MCPTARISYPHFVFQIKNQTKNDAAIAIKKDRFSGEYLIFTPNKWANSLKVGNHYSLGSATVWGPICLKSLITSTSKNTIKDEAIKLNIIVVITTWLPLFA